jgi:holo-[acyl-carrier protein] synthase
MLGVDMVKISRIEGFLNRFGDRGLKRFLLPSEIEALNIDKIGSIAGLWAVKEAVSKAVGTGIGKDLSFHDIETYKDSRSAPKVRLSEKVMRKFGIREVAVSITHDGEYAVAVATILKDN